MSNLVLSKLLTVSSHTRDSGTSTNFTCNLQNEGSILGATAVSVKSIYFENMISNINSHNDTMLISLDGVVYTVTLPHRQVDADEFASMLTTAISGQTPYLTTVTLGADNKLIFETSVPLGLLSERDGNTTADACGITATTTPVNTLVFPQEVINLFGPGEILIHCKELASGNMTLNQYPVATTVDVLDTICLSETIYGAAYCSRSQDLNIDSVAYTKKRDIRSISIKLTTSDSDRALTMPANFKFIITLKLFYET